MTDKNIPNVKATAPKPSAKAELDSAVANAVTEAQKPEQEVVTPAKAVADSKVADKIIEAEKPEATVQPDVQEKEDTAVLVAVAEGTAARAKRDRAEDGPKATHNPLTIPWPTDPQGTLSALKRGGVEAAKRINGNPERLANYKRTLRLLLQHADARFEVDTGSRSDARENALQAAIRVSNKAKRLFEKEAEAAEALARVKRERADNA